MTLGYSQVLKTTAKFPPLLPWIFFLMFLWMALAMVPMPPQPPGTGLDASWAHALNLAHAQNLIFGRDVVFTFGPLGYLYNPVPGLAEPFLALACIWAVHGLFLIGVLLIWRSFGHRLIVFVSWAVLSGNMLLTSLPFERMQLSFLSIAIGIVASLVARGDAGPGYLAIAGTMAGLMPLFKTNEGIAACAIYYILLASLFLTTGKDSGTARRKVWAFALVPPLVFIFAFVLVERNISGLWSFLTTSLQLVMGYSEAMATPGPAYQAILAVFSLLALGFVIPLLAVCPRDLRKGFMPALIAAFFAFKSGVVRQDEMHVDLLQIKLAVAGLFLLVCTRNVRDQRLSIAYVLASFSFGAILYQQAFPLFSQTAKSRALLSDTLANLSASWHFSSTWEQLNKYNRQRLEKLRLDGVIFNAVIGGTVDDVPFELDIVEANGWRWKPRPVFQSYSAYTPALDQLNARHLASRESAEHIILQWEDIDGRHPLLDDAASWRSLFDHYDVELSRPDLLVLKRRESARYLAPRPIGSVNGAWASDIAVPAPTTNGFIIMRAEIGKSLYGILRGMLFRNDATYLNATHISGAKSRWRVTRANLVNGALLAYLPRNLREALPYFGQAGDGLPDRVVSIRFESPGQLEFSSTIRISWLSVAFRPDNSGNDSLPKPAAVEPVPATGPLAHRLEMETRGFVDYINDRPLSKSPVEPSANGLITVMGWAIDAPAHRIGSAVYIDIDGQLFPTSYGWSRPDVSEALKEPAYEKSGFRGEVRASPGSHNGSLRIVNAAGTGYYAGPSFVLNVK